MERTMNIMKYAVQIKFDDSWMYVTDGSLDENVLVFTSEDVAEQLAVTWRKPGHEDQVRVQEYVET